MTDKPEQRSVALAHNLRGYMNVQIDELLRTLEDRAGQLEQAFMAELAHLDELFTDADPEDVSQDNLLQVERFDKGYARTMACIQAATERLVEARAHIARITNTIETHQAFTGNGCNQPYPVANADATINCSITGTIDCDVVSMRGITPGKTVAIEGHTVEYNPLPTKETHHE